MEARIYQPAKTAMQSGRAKTQSWRLEFEPETASEVDSLMGWSGSADMRGQVVLNFASREAAVDFCEKRGIPYRVHEPQRRKVKIKSYADNFRYDRVT
jgi:hypothetical protein